MVKALSIQEAIQRIRRMEASFTRLQNALREHPRAVTDDPGLQEELEALTRYYQGGQWLRDYELDEQGLLPQDLKRGVLAQDGLYDFLDRIQAE